MDSGANLAPFCRGFASQNVSWERLGASWSVLGASWGRLGASWVRLGVSWAHLEVSWKRLGDVLGASWKRLGSVLEASWKPPGPFWAKKAGQHGSKMAPKTEAKSITKTI